MKMRRRAGVICLEDEKLLMVRLTDPSTNRSHLFPPGGAIEEGESPEQAAIREALEETGYEVTLTGPEIVHHYPFEWGGLTHQCETHFFRAKVGKQVAFPQETVVWQPLATLPEVITYQGHLRDILFSLLKK